MSRRRHGLHRCCGPCGCEGLGGPPVRRLGETVAQLESLQRSDDVFRSELWGEILPRFAGEGTLVLYEADRCHKFSYR
jgi:hypothetical protein